MKLDFKTMKVRFNMPTEDWWAYLEQLRQEGKENVTIHYGKEGNLAHIDRGGKILGVFHIDSVQEHGWNNHFKVVKTPPPPQEPRFEEWTVTDQKTGKTTTYRRQVNATWGRPKDTQYPVVMSPTTDDRIGAFTIMDVLPSLGVVCDVLICENEERGNSTAKYYNQLGINKEYNWLLEFDRGGDDTVMYDYETEEYRDIIREYGWKCNSRGSYTDICSLYHLGITGFNFSTGMYNYHSQDGYICLGEYTDSIQKFVVFWSDFEDVKLPYVPKPKPVYTHTRSSGRSNRYNQDYWDGDLVWDSKTKSYHYRSDSKSVALLPEPASDFKMEEESLVEISGYLYGITLYPDNRAHFRLLEGEEDISWTTSDFMDIAPNVIYSPTQNVAFMKGKMYIFNFDTEEWMYIPVYDPMDSDSENDTQPINVEDLWFSGTEENPIVTVDGKSYIYDPTVDDLIRYEPHEYDYEDDFVSHKASKFCMECGAYFSDESNMKSIDNHDACVSCWTDIKDYTCSACGHPVWRPMDRNSIRKTGMCVKCSEKGGYEML